MNLILNIYKESGLSSFDVIRHLRKSFGVRKFGFAGTLDPFATGVLPVFSESYTKLIPFLRTDKEYSFTIRLGMSTDTMDITGNITDRADVPEITADIVSECVERHFLGTHMQTPPAFSALKIDGQRAYKLARKNGYVDMKPRETELKSFSINKADRDTVKGRISVSSGFYVRSFAAELAAKLGTAGTLEALERVRCGPFTSDKSLRMENVSENDSAGIEDVLDNMGKILMNDDDIMKLRNGQSIEYGFPDGRYLLMNESSTNIIIGECSSGTMRTLRGII